MDYFFLKGPADPTSLVHVVHRDTRMANNRSARRRRDSKILKQFGETKRERVLRRTIKERGPDYWNFVWGEYIIHPAWVWANS